MRFWRRIIAVLVALVFASSSSLASMPLVWCAGSDGHRAIEYKIGGTHVDHPVLGQKRQSAKASLDTRSADPDDCQDWRLIGTPNASALQADHGLLTFDLRVTVGLPALHIPTLTEVARATYSPPPEITRPDPQRVALRSAVLLI